MTDKKAPVIPPQPAGQRIESRAFKKGTIWCPKCKQDKSRQGSKKKGAFILCADCV